MQPLMWLALPKLSVTPQHPSLIVWY